MRLLFFDTSAFEFHLRVYLLFYSKIVYCMFFVFRPSAIFHFCLYSKLSKHIHFIGLMYHLHGPHCLISPSRFWTQCVGVISDMGKSTFACPQRVAR